MLYMKYGKIGFMASKGMSFENVDGCRTDVWLYYKLTYEPSDLCRQCSFKCACAATHKVQRHDYLSEEYNIV